MKAKDKGNISSFDVGGGSPMITHLQFADDTIFFLDNDLEQVHNLKAVLLAFSLALGLRINFSKSKIFGVGDRALVAEAAAILGCIAGSLPSRHLGLPLGSSSRSKGIWDPVIETMEKRLALWKSKMISKGGRLTLIKSALSNIPIYHLSLFHLPASVARKLDSIVRNFLWCGVMEGRKFVAVAWDRVCTPVSSGGLGIRLFKDMNVALLSKWLWRYEKEKDSLRRKVIRHKYHSRGRSGSHLILRRPMAWGYGDMEIYLQS